MRFFVPLGCWEVESEFNMGYSMSLIIHFGSRSIWEIAELFDIWIVDMIHSSFGNLKSRIQIQYGVNKFDDLFVEVDPFWK